MPLLHKVLVYEYGAGLEARDLESPQTHDGLFPESIFINPPNAPTFEPRDSRRSMIKSIDYVNWVKCNQSSLLT